MELETLEKLWTIAGTIGIMLITYTKVTQRLTKSITEDENEPDGMISQQLEVTAIQTDMLDRLLKQVENNNKLITDMQTQLNDLKARNAELETYKNEQAEQIDRLKARVAQLEAELKHNDLPVPSPEGDKHEK
mgnify:CR=1 FL=1